MNHFPNKSEQRNQKGSKRKQHHQDFVHAHMLHPLPAFAALIQEENDCTILPVKSVPKKRYPSNSIS